jgi:NADH-quinone oxidoreductase subunit C
MQSMSDPSDPRPRTPDTPDPEPKSTADASAPISDPPGLADAVAQPSDPAAGGSQTEPTATQEAEPIKTQVADVELANVEAMVERLDDAGTAASDPWGRAAYVDDDVERHPAVRVLRERFPGTILEIVRFRDETTIHVRRQDLRAVCAALRDDDRVQFNFLSDLTAVDMLRLRERPRFDVVVQLYSLSNRVRLRIKAGCNDGESVPSLVPLWNSANWLEREVFDMFGIIFEGHPNLRRMLLADDWEEGFPLRKDYPLRGWREFPVYNQERTVGRVRTRWTGRGPS